jgi:hypothetical protein
MDGLGGIHASVSPVVLGRADPNIVLYDLALTTISTLTSLQQRLGSISSIHLQILTFLNLSLRVLQRALLHTSHSFRQGD